MSDGKPAGDGATANMEVRPAPPTSAATRAMNKPGGDPLLGTVLMGRYKVIKRLGEGGMGTVYLGEHTTIRKKFAIKVLSADMAQKQDVRQRFLQEAQAASMISQENVVEITDYGDTPDGRTFFVMEFLPGEDLADTIKSQGALPWMRVKPMMLQVCAALGAAHAVGIIHRDMKPDNIFRIKRGSNEDFCKVLDFGIAKVNSPESEDGGKGLTKTGMIFGTPEYMSPEQAQGQKVDARVDVYAMGVILFELLTGQVPFTGENFMAILTKHLFEAPPAPTAVKPDLVLPPGVEEIILKAMQKDRELRFASMQEFADAINSIGTGAVPVAVVEEQLSAPVNVGEMQFSGSSAPSGQQPTTGYPVAQASGTIPPYGQPKSKAPIYAAAALIAMAGIGTAAFMAGQGGEEPPPAEPVAVVGSPTPETEPAPVVEPEPEPEPDVVKQLAPEVPTVKLTIETNVPAKILDAADEGMYGMTNEPGGVKVEKSKERHAFILRAKGYEDLRLEFVPSRDKTFSKDLTPLPASAPKKKRREREKEVSAYDLPGVDEAKPKLKELPDTFPSPEAKPKPKPAPAPAAEPEPKPEPPKPAPKPSSEPSKDATPTPPKKKTPSGKTKELIDPFGD